MNKIKLTIPLVLMFLMLGFVMASGQEIVSQQYTGANYVHLDSTDSGTIYHHFGAERGISTFDTTVFRGIQRAANDGDMMFSMRIDSLSAGEMDSIRWRIDTMTWDGRIQESFWVTMTSTGAAAVSTTEVYNYTGGSTFYVPDNSPTSTSGTVAGTEVHWVDLSAQYTPCFGFKHTISITHKNDATHGAQRSYIYPIVVK